MLRTENSFQWAHAMNEEVFRHNVWVGELSSKVAKREKCFISSSCPVSEKPVTSHSSAESEAFWNEGLRSRGGEKKIICWQLLQILLVASR